MKLTDLVLAEKIYIAGDGLEGQAADKFCQGHCPDVPREIISSVFDSVEDNGGVWIVSPGIPRKHFSHIPAERVTAGTEIFFDSLTDAERARVIGISGTKGKSTTTKFCVEALNAAGKSAIAAGNFGVPLLEVFDAFRNKTIEYVVAELSSYQLENLRTSPGIAIFLNIFPDHLDRHGSFDSYQKAKSNLWKYQENGDILITSKNTEIQHESHKSELLSAEIFPEDSSFRAKHWCENFGTIKSLFDILGLPEEAIQKTAESFQGLPHRLQQFSTFENRTWWDDAICTNPEAACATVQFFGEKLGALIVGGQARGMDVRPLADILRKNASQGLVFVLESEASNSFLDVIEGSISVKDFDEAVRLVIEKTERGSNVVLCPAAPSYDSFKNYKEKGDAWQEAVKECEG